MTAGKKILAVLGPTAVGKSALALRLAREIGGEIVSADSRQVYRYMDIGTAKPSKEQRAAVPHHLIDVADPDEEYSLALFLRQAGAAIEDIQSRSRLPILVGGSGQYVWALLEGWQVPNVPPDPALRRRLEQKAASEGARALYEELSGLDLAAARRIDPENVRRVVRALEVHHSAPQSAKEAPRSAPAYEQVVLGLTLERADLYERADRRVDSMIEAGWVEEVRRLLDRGFGPELPSLSSLGYMEVAQHLSGEYSIEEAVVKIKLRTHRFARQQYGWFRLEDQRIRWFQGKPDGVEEAAAYVREALRG